MCSLLSLWLVLVTIQATILKDCWLKAAFDANTYFRQSYLLSGTLWALVRSWYSDLLRARRSRGRMPVGATRFVPFQNWPWGPASPLEKYLWFSNISHSFLEGQGSYIQSQQEVIWRNVKFRLLLLQAYSVWLTWLSLSIGVSHVSVWIQTCVSIICN